MEQIDPTSKEDFQRYWQEQLIFAERRYERCRRMLGMEALEASDEADTK